LKPSRTIWLNPAASLVTAILFAGAVISPASALDLDLICTIKGGANDGKSFPVKLASGTVSVASPTTEALWRAGGGRGTDGGATLSLILSLQNGRTTTFETDSSQEKVFDHRTWQRTESVRTDIQTVGFGFETAILARAGTSPLPAMVGPTYVFRIDRNTGGFEEHFNGSITVGSCAKRKAQF